ncbi:hypothetical protein G647_06314 [Cladophialophora carrionii CBS 160.54]|uniref:Uncharacterized protein n=1 Tax=Cladophialophora carrionii CBS 160.54 TaxID=1279043 RepID=V9D6E6_9EURO|nr:uncharacterized protein G647_06314 [Cladophialophora carrionii CBS 160.54]ETI22241.1 hypothetical protein G647_06314 [Cladophialophora carrionii CBS 160.54]
MLIFNLPKEVLAQIVRYANFNGDLPGLRLVHPRLLGVLGYQYRLLLEDTLLRYGISSRTLSLYRSQHVGRPFPHSDLDPVMLDVLALDRFLRETGSLAVDAEQALRPLHNVLVEHQPSSREPFMLFAAFTRVLNSSTTVSHTTAFDLLAPSPNGAQTYSKRYSDSFLRFLKQELTLVELEAIIGAISVCAMKLWSTVFVFRPKDSTVTGFGSLSGASFNTDQAILTEHIIWKGPLWAARVLELYGPAETGATSTTQVDAVVGNNLIKDAVWRGTREEGARLAANGLARLLWKERQERIEAKASSTAEKISITDMRVNPSVWRGSSGDM